MSCNRCGVMVYPPGPLWKVGGSEGATRLLGSVTWGSEKRYWMSKLIITLHLRVCLWIEYLVVSWIAYFEYHAIHQWVFIVELLPQKCIYHAQSRKRAELEYFQEQKLVENHLENLAKWIRLIHRVSYRTTMGFIYFFVLGLFAIKIILDIYSLMPCKKW